MHTYVDSVPEHWRIDEDVLDESVETDSRGNRECTISRDGSSDLDPVIVVYGFDDQYQVALEQELSTEQHTGRVDTHILGASSDDGVQSAITDFIDGFDDGSLQATCIGSVADDEMVSFICLFGETATEIDTESLFEQIERTISSPDNNGRSDSDTETVIEADHESVPVHVYPVPTPTDENTSDNERIDTSIKH